MLFFIYHNELEDDESSADTFVTLIKDQINIGLCIEFVELLNETVRLGFNEKKRYYVCYFLLSFEGNREFKIIRILF